MVKKLFIPLLSGLIAGNSFAAAYKIPEQSNRSMATSGAYMSSADSADASYYCPSNMSWFENSSMVEVGLRYIILPSIQFEGQALDPVQQTFVIADAKSKEEHFLVPYFHYVSPELGDFRLGVSFVTPGGLSKRWTAKIPKATAEEFTLKILELSTNLSYKISENLSVAAGIRGVYATGEVKYQYQPFYSMDLKGDTSIKIGYDLSLTIKPTKRINFSVLYRSKVNLKLEGDANGNLGAHIISPHGGSVMVPLPAELRTGISYNTGKTIFEFTYEKTYWSSYEKLDFDFDDPVIEDPSIAGSKLGIPQPKNWEDSNTFRIGVTHHINKKWTGIIGIAYDETPIPEKSVGFELPDSNAWIFSFGGIYKPSQRVEIGFAYLYVTKFDREVTNPKVNGLFSDLSARLFNVSLGYSF